MIVLLLQLAGAAALLIWSVRLIRTGVERAYSLQLRRWLRRSHDSLPTAALTGAIAALMLQSSTAVAMLTANFAAAGTLGATVGLAILLGADVGSALVAQVLTLRLTWLAPLLLLVGVSLFLRTQRRGFRQTGRIIIGVALVFVSLKMIGDATAPLRDAEGVARVMTYLAGDPISTFLIGAAIAWVIHSSVAAILLFLALVVQQVLPINAAIALVLGANLGGSLIAFWLTLGAALPARRIVIANLILRGGGAVLAMILIAAFSPAYSLLGSTEYRQVINFHLVFNIAILIAGFPLIGPITQGLAALMAEPPDTAKAMRRPSALNPSAQSRPDLAIACVARELMHMGETIQAMLMPIMGLMTKWNPEIAEAIRRREDDVNRMNFEIKLYLARLQRGDLDDTAFQRCMDLSNISVDFEAAGDAISKNMLGIARRIQNEGLAFSPNGLDELSDFHDQVLSNVQLALNVLMTNDPEAARMLVEQKERVREVEQALQASHLDRLRRGSSQSIETSNMHQEMVRALKQVNTAFSVVAYPILKETGDLLSSRLTDPEDEDP